MDYQEARQHFLDAEEKLKAEGYEVFNPFAYGERIFGEPGSLSWDGYMMAILPFVTQCDAIYMLDGWRESYGANIEYLWAIRCGKTVFFENCSDKGMDLIRDYDYYKRLYEEYLRKYLNVCKRNRKAYKWMLVALVSASIALISQVYALIKHLL